MYHTGEELMDIKNCGNLTNKTICDTCIFGKRAVTNSWQALSLPSCKNTRIYYSHNHIHET